MKMIKSTRYRFLIVLLIACFLLVCLVLRTSIKFDGLLQKLRNFHQVMKVTRPPRVVFTVTQNNRKGSSNTPQTYGNKYWRTKDNTATWNDNLKRVTTGTKTDNIKVYPSKTHDLNIYPKTDEKYSGYGEISSCKKNPNRFILAKLFEYWMKLAEKEKIEYFLTCGTLLGAYRNGDIIPDDTDMDILVNRNDFLKIKKHRTRKKFTGFENEISVYVNKDFYQPYAKRRRFKCSGKRVSSYQDHCSFQEPLGRIISQNRHVDIYDYTRKGDKLWDPSENGRTFHMSEVFPLRKCHIMTYETFCPNNPLTFLRKFYDDLAPITVCENGTWVRIKNS